MTRSTPAAMALHLGLGVCQDYAHLAVALLERVATRWQPRVEIVGA